jgi:hypothetical protein
VAPDHVLDEGPTNLPPGRHFSKPLQESDIRANGYLTALDMTPADRTLLSVLCLADKQCIDGPRTRCTGADALSLAV